MDEAVADELLGDRLAEVLGDRHATVAGGPGSSTSVRRMAGTAPIHGRS